MSIPAKNPPPIVIAIGLKLSITISDMYPRGYINVIVIHVVFIRIVCEFIILNAEVEEKSKRIQGERDIP